MASPTPKRPHNSKRYPPRPPAGPPEVVDPRWLVKALAITVAVAILCGYLAVCLLVYQGGWQLMLHPSTKVKATPSIPFQALRFDAAETGSPRLSGWWIPAESPTPTTPTILYLHDGSGSLGDTVPKLELLHRAGVNLFAIDYRGFGLSDPTHPTEARMTEDAAAAFDYLTATRHLSGTTIVPYGEGLGAVLAVTLANAQAEIPAFIADTPDAGAFGRVTGSRSSRLLPMTLLVQEHFDFAAPLAAAHKPKLLIADSPFTPDRVRIAANQSVFRAAPDPKFVVTFDHPDSGDAYVQAVTRFLDENLHRP